MDEIGIWTELLISKINQTQYVFWHFFAMGLFLLHLEKRARKALRIFLSIIVLLVYSEISGIVFALGATALIIAWYISVFFLNAAVGKGICKISWTEAFYCSICGTFTEHLFSSFYVFLFAGGGMLRWTGRSYYIVGITIYLLTYLLVARRLPIQGHYEVSKTTVLTTSGLGLSVTIGLSFLVKQMADPVNNYVITNTVANQLLRYCQIYAICFCLLMLAMQLFHHRDTMNQREKAVNQILWEQRQAQYQLSKDTVDLISQKCHDMKHQIAALTQTEGSSSKERFVKEVQDMIEFYDAEADTGNEILNTILTQYSLYCKMHGIQWSCIADGSMLSFMDSIDLYTLMGNALDNAIESVEKIEDPEFRIILLQIGQKGQFAVIQLENSYEGEIKLKSGVPTTSKSDQRNHGFGLRSIRSIAERYQGSASIQITPQHEFILKVVIPLRAKSGSTDFDAKTTG